MQDLIVLICKKESHMRISKNDLHQMQNFLTVQVKFATNGNLTDTVQSKKKPGLLIFRTTCCMGSCYGGGGRHGVKCYEQYSQAMELLAQ